MFSFYGRFIKRQWRQGTIRLFCVAVTIACAVTFSITLLGDRLEQLFENQSKEVLAADLVLKTSKPLTAEQVSIVEDSPLEQAKTLGFITMASAGEKLVLSSVKAVTDLYPLRGTLQVTDKLFGDPESVSRGPARGEAWVEDRILHELGIEPGQNISIGETEFPVTKIIIFEPDRGNNFYSFTPRIMMHWDDVQLTEVVQPGSRVKYRYLFSGDAALVASLNTQLEPTLQLNQKFLTIESANEALNNTLNRAYRFLYITALIAILLGAVSAALVSYQYANDMTYQYAVLRCLGLRGKRLSAAILFPFFVFTLVSILFGLLIGGLTHFILLNSLGGLLPDEMPMPGPAPYLVSSITALLVVTSFAWPFLHQLLKTPPRVLLNREHFKQTRFLGSAVVMAAGITLIIYLGTREVVISFVIMGALLIFLLLAYYLTRFIINRIIKRGMHRNIQARLAARMLAANRQMSSLQILAIAVTFFSLALIQTLRDDMLAAWQSKVPENAPNFFAINLMEQDRHAFLESLDQKSITHTPLYPIVRGRLSAINGEPIREYVSKEKDRDHESLNRDLSLTWSLDLPADNRILDGQWHNVTDTGAVSVEEGVASNLQIEVGDTLEFTIETRKVSAVVTSLRSVEWESFRPNFYMIFTPDVLQDLPVTYLASMHLDPHQRSLLPAFVRQFSSTTFFDVDFLLKRIRGISQQLSTAVETILYFALAASLVVFMAIEMILRHYRSYSTAIYKAVGATSHLIQKVFRLQFLLIGLTAGLMAYLLNLVIGFLVSSYVIEGDYVFNIKTAVLCLVITPLLVICAGYFSIKRTRNTPAKNLLAEQ